MRLIRAVLDGLAVRLEKRTATGMYETEWVRPLPGWTLRQLAEALAEPLRELERDEHAALMMGSTLAERTAAAAPFPPQPIPADAAFRPLTGGELSRCLGEQP